MNSTNFSTIIEPALDVEPVELDPLFLKTYAYDDPDQIDRESKPPPGISNSMECV